MCRRRKEHFLNEAWEYDCSSFSSPPIFAALQRSRTIKIYKNVMSNLHTIVTCPSPVWKIAPQIKFLERAQQRCTVSLSAWNWIYHILQYFQKAQKRPSKKLVFLNHCKKTTFILGIRCLFEMVNCYLFKIHLYKQNNDNNSHKDKVTFFLIR